jgi:hypothetical protein
MVTMILPQQEFAYPPGGGRRPAWTSRVVTGSGQCMDGVRSTSVPVWSFQGAAGQMPLSGWTVNFSLTT